MIENYTTYFTEIDDAVHKNFDRITIEFKLIGFSALEIAGLPERGTKDVDTLKTDILNDPKNMDVLNFLEKEYGKRSPGSFRYGMYLDIVPVAIVWLPPQPQFISFKKFNCLNVTRLNPTDVLISKTFSNFLSSANRKQDVKDIFDAFDTRLVDPKEYIKRLDEALPKYEIHAEALEIFPKVIDFVEKRIIPYYIIDGTMLSYTLPNWMLNY
ncbi:MAG: hypothetical protein ABIE74_04545 [Pseudomonadota bacterium]